MKTIKEFWSMNEGTFACLHDRKRTEAFKKAIKKSVSKGDVVLELGAGSGILSMFAVDAGAEKVYAVELDHGNAVSLRHNIRNNGYANKIIVIEGDATTLEIPEKVDFIICEMIATGLIEELQIPAMNHALKFLKPTGKVLLKQYDVYIELVESKNIFYNKKFDVIRFELPEMRDMKSKSLTKRVLLKAVHLDKKNINAINESILADITSKGTANALKITAVTLFSDGSTFSESTSYSFPVVLPLNELPVKKGEKVRINISYKMCTGPHTLKYSVEK